MLKDDLKVTCVVNFQTADDLRENWIDERASLEERTPAEAHRIYSRFRMNYIHVPTTDMDTEARSMMIANAAWLLAGILANSSTTGVYVHCNAGVGRSVAAVCGYLRCYLKLPSRMVNLIVCSRRPVAFFDPVAVRLGEEDYAKKFGTVRAMHE
eukprot:Polyplicarium_translucidae@DN1264_c0_g1_i1.p2